MSVTSTTAGFILACATVGPVTYMAVDREPPFVRVWGEIIPGEVESEQEFEVHWVLRVNEHRNCKPFGRFSVERAIIDSAGAITPFRPVSSIADPLNTMTEIRRKVRLPMGLTKGPARYHVSAKFTCNILQEIMRWPVAVEHPDIPFVVKPKSPPTPSKTG